MNLQPTLRGELITLEPLESSDLENLFEVASELFIKISELHLRDTGLEPIAEESSVATTTTEQPHITAVAGLVPCAEAGMRATFLWP